MKYLLFLSFSLFFFSANTKAQKTEKRFSKQIKIYANAAFETTRTRLPHATPHDSIRFEETTKFGFRNISASFSFEPAFGNINEIELSQLSIKKTQTGTLEESRFTMGLRYEIATPISRNFNTNHSFKFYFGFFAESFFQHFKLTSTAPSTLTFFTNSSSTLFILNLGPVVRSQYWFNDRFFLDLNVPLTAAFFNMSTFPKIKFTADWLFRLGGGMRL